MHTGRRPAAAVEQRRNGAAGTVEKATQRLRSCPRRPQQPLRGVRRRAPPRRHLQRVVSSLLRINPLVLLSRDPPAASEAHLPRHKIHRPHHKVHLPHHESTTYDQPKTSQRGPQTTGSIPQNVLRRCSSVRGDRMGKDGLHASSERSLSSKSYREDSLVHA